MDEALVSELVRRAKTGDVSAFEALYRHFGDRIFHFARQVTGSAEDARDVTQEAFIRAWDSLPSLKSESAFGVWLHRIALNLSSDAVKRRKRQRAVSLDDTDGDSQLLQVESTEPTPEKELISSERLEAVRHAVESLSPEHRIVVTMHHMEGMEVESIAQVLSIPRGTVMSRLSRAREILRRKLVPYVEGDQS